MLGTHLCYYYCSPYSSSSQTLKTSVETVGTGHYQDKYQNMTYLFVKLTSTYEPNCFTRAKSFWEEYPLVTLVCVTSLKQVLRKHCKG